VPAAASVATALRGTPYAAGAREALERAARAPGDEARALGAVRDGAIEGVVVYGTFAGSSGAGRLHVVAVSGPSRRTGAGRALVDGALLHLSEAGARFLLAELPDDAGALPGAREFLATLGFREESRVEDFFRDGIALSFQRREIAG
jgi:ribosomal protein S18 acetylase RimI-like enzyme